MLGIVVYAALFIHSVAAENPAVKAMRDYFEFAPYEAGIIVPQQLTEESSRASSSSIRVTPLSSRRGQFLAHAISSGAKC